MLQELISLFLRFLQFRLPNRETGLLSGDALSRLEKDWEMWLVTEAPEDTIQLLKAAGNDPILQSSFLKWLNEQQEFGGEVSYLACFQLVRCEGFANWSELSGWRDPEFQGRTGRVLSIFLRGDKRDSPGLVKTMLAVLGPESRSKEPGKILPLNFSLVESDEPTWRCLEEARRASLNFLGLKGIPFWITYLAAGDFIGWTVYRLSRFFLFHWVHLRRTLSISNVYLLINTRIGTGNAL